MKQYLRFLIRGLSLNLLFSFFFSVGHLKAQSCCQCDYGGGTFRCISYPLANDCDNACTGINLALCSTVFGGSPSGLNCVASDCSSLSCAETTILPIELVDFSASLFKNEVILSWETASELDNEGFEVQRSSDGENWKTLRFINGSGTTSIQQKYSYSDRPGTGQFYYRLKQIDFGGTYTFSEVISVTVEDGNLELFIYPNPVLDVLVIRKFRGTATLFDASGRQVQVLALNQNLQDNIEGVIDFRPLPSGNYVLVVTDEKGNRFTKKIIK